MTGYSLELILIFSFKGGISAKPPQRQAVRPPHESDSFTLNQIHRILIAGIYFLEPQGLSGRETIASFSVALMSPCPGTHLQPGYSRKVLPFLQSAEPDFTGANDQYAALSIHERARRSIRQHHASGTPSNPVGSGRFQILEDAYQS